jgi:hypothetical protein
MDTTTDTIEAEERYSILPRRAPCRSVAGGRQVGRRRLKEPPLHQDARKGSSRLLTLAHQPSRAPSLWVRSARGKRLGKLLRRDCRRNPHVTSHSRIRSVAKPRSWNMRGMRSPVRRRFCSHNTRPTQRRWHAFRSLSHSGLSLLLHGTDWSGTDRLASVSLQQSCWRHPSLAASNATSRHVAE